MFDTGLYTKEIHGDSKIFGQRRFKSHAPVGAGMDQSQFRGMKKLAGRNVAAGFFEPEVLASAIDQIPQHRAAEMFQVNADLMSPPGVQAQFNPRHVLQLFQHPIAGARLASAARVTAMRLRWAGWRAMEAMISPAARGIRPQTMA